MYPIKNCSIFFIYLFLLSNLLITIHYSIAEPQPDFVYQYCYGDNYTRGSTFQTNLNLLFPSSIQNRYYNATNGQTPDTVYGSLQCRGDIQQDECQSCINFATQDFNKTGRCPNSKQAIIWYDKCMLRYSNEYYFNIMQESPGGYLWVSGDVSNPNQYNKILGDLLDDLAGQAGSSFSSNFATGNKSINNFQKIYGLVECSPDIPSGSCNRCLRGAISELQNCCHGKSGARVIRPSCDLRYELDDPFFESTATPSPPPPPLSSTVPPPPSTTSATVPNANRNNSSKLTISIVVPSVIAVLSAIAIGFFFIRRRKSQRKKFDGHEDFDFSTVSAATHSFSEANKLGEGGFGSVYKVWRHWNKGSAMEILDPTLNDACSRKEVLRCIHVALLCVQENVAVRPTMPIVVQMLNSYSATNPALPLAPAFFAGSTIGNSEAATWSRNEVSVTELDPR
ncbi:hypothetical protein MKW92_036008 [Papaver armeniacum]|nr:hypothetical protein MKW92_036008 [Papaver armeniacum]